jgi:phosphatidyl-myo-inositol dimannoside synthase
MASVAVIVESRYLQTPDGSVWTFEGPAYPFYKRYLAAFDAVEVVARVSLVREIPAGAHVVTGPNVYVHRIPCYQGPREFVMAWPQVRSSLKRVIGPNKLVIFRVPSVLASMLAPMLERRNIDYAIEVMGDPHDVFAPGVVSTPLRPFLRYQYTKRLRHLARSAVGVSYVTENYLQARYPASASAITASYSSIELTHDSFTEEPRLFTKPVSAPEIVSVGSLDQLYKGVDTLIEAIGILVGGGKRARLTHIGDGIYRSHLETLTSKLSLSDHVKFAGRLPAGAPIRAYLDRADIFVMPSRTEGLPKALLESMARALPSIGTSVGGIPEVLDSRFLVPPDDPNALAAAISELSDSPEAMLQASSRNLDVSRKYEAGNLAIQRQAFYSALRERSLGPRPGVTEES